MSSSGKYLDKTGKRDAAKGYKKLDILDRFLRIIFNELGDIPLAAATARDGACFSRNSIHIKALL